MTHSTHGEGDSSLFKRRGDNYEIAKIYWRNKKNPAFFSRTKGTISTELGTKHPWVKGIQVCSNEGHCLFPRTDNFETAKIHWQNLKKQLGQFKPNLAQTILG